MVDHVEERPGLVETDQDLVDLAGLHVLQDVGARLGQCQFHVADHRVVGTDHLERPAAQSAEDRNGHCIARQLEPDSDLHGEVLPLNPDGVVLDDRIGEEPIG